MLGKYIGWTRIYLVVLTVLIVLRFGLEAAGVSSSVTSPVLVHDARLAAILGPRLAGVVP